MDSFTEKLLSRVRERQKFLEDYNSHSKKDSPIKKNTSSEPNLSSPETQVLDLKTNSEGNLSKTSHLNTSDFTTHKTLNIHDDYFNMEIKVSSAENVSVEVQIEEKLGDEENANFNDCALRQDAKNRLNRLGKLYAGENDISSPIHQTEDKFYTEESSKNVKMDRARTKRGLSKLADLAQRVNEYEDDLSNVHKEKLEETYAKPKKSWKPPAPQPPKMQKVLSPPKKYVKSKAPNPPSVVEEPLKKEEKFAWDKEVLDSLESQGFTRSESSSKLIYNYSSRAAKENTPQNTNLTAVVSSQKQIPQKGVVADKAALFESQSPMRAQKDPALLSVSERKALFEKNKGAVLIPKAPFAMATPIRIVQNTKENVKKIVPTPTKQEQVQPVPAKGEGIAQKVVALLEAKSTISQEEIENNIKEQRKREMEVLLNRFHTPAAEENEDENATEETRMIEAKPVNIVTSKEDRRSSGSKRCSQADSPKVTAVLNDVKRIKVFPQKAGRLYPSLTDIESQTETENETPNENSSTESSFAESDDANTSFGRDILQAVCKNQTPQKRQSLEDNVSDISDVLDNMDDYLDEALAYNGGQSNGPTPPKIGRKSPIETSHSFNYKHFHDENDEFKSPLKKPLPLKSDENFPTHVIDGDNVLPLTHTVSFYRKQQSQVSTTPLKQISRQSSTEESPRNYPDEGETVKKKILELKNDILKQEMIISQTSQALNLCNSTPEFIGSTEQVEAERVLLVSTHRRQAAMHEKQRLEVEKTLRPRRQCANEVVLQKGDLTISKISLPLKKKYVTALAAAGGKGHHVVCLVKCAEQVLPTQLISTVASNTKNPEMELSIPGTVTVRNICSDFTITFEVYCLQAQEEILPHEVKYHIKKPSAKLTTPKKSKQDSRLIYPVKESPAGPQVVRSPTFALMGYIVFSIETVNKKQWTLINTPSMSPLEGTVEMCISCEFELSVEYRGFLTMFEDISGFGAWHRRWCLLKGDTLSYWKYPDDEKRSLPINSISLKESITKQVAPVSRDICARLHTFLLETEREGRPHDKDSLVTVRKGPKTIIRHILSADTKEERIEWCNKFNLVLAGINVQF